LESKTLKKKVQRPLRKSLNTRHKILPLIRARRNHLEKLKKKKIFEVEFLPIVISLLGAFPNKILRNLSKITKAA
jgi:hypothetical protein